MPAENNRTMWASAGRVAGLTGLWIGLGAGIGATGDAALLSSYENYRGAAEGIADYSDYQKLEADVDVYEKRTVNLEQREGELDSKFGAACVRALQPYTPGGTLEVVVPEVSYVYDVNGNVVPATDTQLAETAQEDSIVGDLQSSPKLPCGDEPTKIREATREVLDVEAGLADLATFDYSGAQATLQEAKAHADRSEKTHSVMLGLKLGALVFGALAAASSVISERDYRWQKSQPVVKRKNDYYGEHEESYVSRRFGFERLVKGRMQYFKKVRY